MHRGSTGMVGGGIYFAESPAEARTKALHNGVLLEVDVRVGRVHHISFTPDHGMTWAKLKALGCNSVKMTGRPTGVEWIVYSWDQVKSVRMG